MNQAIIIEAAAHMDRLGVVYERLAAKFTEAERREGLGYRKEAIDLLMSEARSCVETARKLRSLVTE